MDLYKKSIDDLMASLDTMNFDTDTRSYGVVAESGDGIVRVEGLGNCKYGELLEFEGGAYGIAFNLEEKYVGAVMLTDAEKVTQGGRVLGTSRVAEVPVGEALLGRVVDPLGKPLDGKGQIKTTGTRPMEHEAPRIIDRQGVRKPLQTGLVAIDAMIPIGRGQRELIIGDRQTGKTAIALDTILNQRDKEVLCIYVSIGQKASTVAGIVQTLEKHGALSYTVVVAATASNSSAMQYLAPYAGCAIAEEFMYKGKDALIIYDDLSKHAVAYRAISLLLRRPPGREAYPGDVFYLHSRLLERSASLSEAMGGGSLTALPIVETQAGDISSYIATNVISITDGQIFLESELFYSGIRPAVNVGFSVSRVGGSAQTKAMRSVASRLRLDLSQYREMAVFAQFSSDLDKVTQQLLAQGERLTMMLKQDQYNPMRLEDMVALLYVVSNQMLLDMSMDKVQEFKQNFIDYIRSNHVDLMNRIAAQKVLSDEDKQEITQAFKDYKALILPPKNGDQPAVK